MRVISGIAKGRTLKAVPGNSTRPTTDKVKEAIFSIIGPYFSGGAVLDLFAGTGGLGIEALSRGMDRAVFVDSDIISVGIVRSNLQATGFTEAAEVYRNDASRALKALAKRGLQFDLVFLDPPYRIKHVDQLIAEMVTGGQLTASATVVAEYDASHDYPEQIVDLKQIRLAQYGDTKVSIYRRLDSIQSESEDFT